MCERLNYKWTGILWCVTQPLWREAIDRLSIAVHNRAIQLCLSLLVVGRWYSRFRILALLRIFLHGSLLLVQVVRQCEVQYCALKSIQPLPESAVVRGSNLKSSV
jgi:hypothetical protein